MARSAFSRHKEANTNKLVVLLLSLIISTQLFANGNNPTGTVVLDPFSVQQNRVTIQGTVTDMKGEPITGAYVIEKGNSNASVTDLNGNFTLEVAMDSELIISFVGYKPQSVPVNGKTNFVIHLEEEALVLETVVVTAMGIKKKEASLTYSTQQINNEELTRAKETNLINSLSGKSPGVQIKQSSSGLAGSVKVTIRGNRSMRGNNQPLYVIDGVPMLNNSNEQASTVMGGISNAGNRDGGDGISNLNPEDIESINVLKGASAAALYGSQAANGVILITTKKGKTGINRITFSSDITFNTAATLPEFQNQYGVDEDKNSWGEKGELKKNDYAGDFFRGGITAINAVSLTRGNEATQTYFSYANTYGKGIIEGNNLSRHNLNLRETANFFNERLTVDANINLMQQTLKNRPVTGGLYMNPLVGIYTFPRGEDIETYRTQFEVNDPERNIPSQNWLRTIGAFEQNPYWITNRVISNDKRYRTIANLSASFKVNTWLTVQARGTVDYIGDKYNQKMYATTAPELAGTYKGLPNGRYIKLDHSELLIYGDFMMMFNKSWRDFSFSGALGSSINKSSVNSLRIDSNTASLYKANVFTVANIVVNENAAIDEKIEQTREIQSIFGTAQVGWKDQLFLDVTARNDWSSTLAFTNNKSFFYPSVGVSWIVSNTLRLPNWVSFGKLRASWSQVGNDLPLFYSKLDDRIAAGGVVLANDKAPFENLKPEISTSYEIGGEWKLFNQRVEVDFTYYTTKTRNQLLTLPSLVGASHKYLMVNAGKIENYGFELLVGATPIMNNFFRWKTGATYSFNKSKIVKLHPNLNAFIYGDEGVSMNYAMRLEEGGSFGDIYGRKFNRDSSGALILDDKGLPTSIGHGNTQKVGNCTPDGMIGWHNTFSYKGFSLYFLIDSRIGGDVLSMTQAELDYRGVSKATGKARDRGFVEYGGQRFTDVTAFYQSVSSRSDLITEYYMYNATNIRLRELSIGYSLPQSIIAKSEVIKSVDFSLIGRNLFFFYKDAPFDPDATMSTANDCQGVDVFGMPTSRSFGFKVKMTF